MILAQQDIRQYYSPIRHVPREYIDDCIRKNLRVPPAKRDGVCGLKAFGFARDGFECDIYPAVECSCPDDWPHLRVFMLDSDVIGAAIIQPSERPLGEEGDHPPAQEAPEYALVGTAHAEAYTYAGTPILTFRASHIILRTGYYAGHDDDLMDELRKCRYDQPTMLFSADDIGPGHILTPESFISPPLRFCLLQGKHERLPEITTVHAIPSVDDNHDIAPVRDLYSGRRQDFEPEYSSVIWDERWPDDVKPHTADREEDVVLNRSIDEAVEALSLYLHSDCYLDAPPNEVVRLAIKALHLMQETKKKAARHHAGVEKDSLNGK